MRGYGRSENNRRAGFGTLGAIFLGLGAALIGGIVGSAIRGRQVANRPAPPRMMPAIERSPTEQVLEAPPARDLLAADPEAPASSEQVVELPPSRDPFAIEEEEPTSTGTFTGFELDHADDLIAGLPAVPDTAPLPEPELHLAPVSPQPPPASEPEAEAETPVAPTSTGPYGLPSGEAAPAEAPTAAPAVATPAAAPTPTAAAVTATAPAAAPLPQDGDLAREFYVRYVREVHLRYRGWWAIKFNRGRSTRARAALRSKLAAGKRAHPAAFAAFRELLDESFGTLVFGLVELPSVTDWVLSGRPTAGWSLDDQMIRLFWKLDELFPQSEAWAD